MSPLFSLQSTNSCLATDSPSVWGRRHFLIVAILHTTGRCTESWNACTLLGMYRVIVHNPMGSHIRDQFLEAHASRALAQLSPLGLSGALTARRLLKMTFPRANIRRFWFGLTVSPCVARGVVSVIGDFLCPSPSPCVASTYLLGGAPKTLSNRLQKHPSRKRKPQSKL